MRVKCVKGMYCCSLRPIYRTTLGHWDLVKAIGASRIGLSKFVHVERTQVGSSISASMATYKGLLASEPTPPLSSAPSPTIYLQPKPRINAQAPTKPQSWQSIVSKTTRACMPYQPSPQELHSTGEKNPLPRNRAESLYSYTNATPSLILQMLSTSSNVRYVFATDVPCCMGEEKWCDAARFLKTLISSLNPCAEPMHDLNANWLSVGWLPGLGLREGECLERFLCHICPSGYLSVLNRVRSKKMSYIRILWSSPAEANMDGFVGLHAIALQHPLWASSFSISWPVSLCQMKTWPSNQISNDNNSKIAEHTFATNHNKALIRTTICSFDDKQSSLLARLEHTDGLSSVQIDHSSFARYIVG